MARPPPATRPSSINRAAAAFFLSVKTQRTPAGQRGTSIPRPATAGGIVFFSASSTSADFQFLAQTHPPRDTQDFLPPSSSESGWFPSDGQRNSLDARKMRQRQFVGSEMV